MENKEEISALRIDDTYYETNINEKFKRRKQYSPKNPKIISAFIPGIITNIYVKNGQVIKPGESLLVLEAMKMKNNVASVLNGTIKSVSVSVGQMVIKGQVLIELE